MKSVKITFLFVTLGLLFLLAHSACIATGADYNYQWPDADPTDIPASDDDGDDDDDDGPVVAEDPALCELEANLDADGDGETTTACGGTDCDDSNADINASADEDGDGYALCDITAENKAADCDDANPLIYADLPADSGWVRQCPIVEIDSLACGEEPHQNIQPTLLKIDDLYVVVYRSCFSNAVRSFGLATSTNLLTWTESAENPIWGPLQDGWDIGWTKVGSAGMSQPWLFYDTVLDDYILYFHAQANADNKRQIGCATANDYGSFDDWGACDDGAPVVTKGAGGKWDDNTVQGPSVIYDDETETYHLFYSGCNIAGDVVWGMGWATSNNGTVWTKQTIDNPLMEDGAVGTWDESSAKFPAVLYDPVIEQYLAIYEGADSDLMDAIGLASFDAPGDAWTKYAGNPILEGYGGDHWERWDSYLGVNVGNLVMTDDNTFLMSYAGQYVPEDEEPEEDLSNVIINIGFAINRRPAFQNLTPNTDIIVDSGTPLTIEGIINDDKPQTVDVTIESNLDGLLAEPTPNNSGYFYLTTSTLSTGVHTITLTSLDSGGLRDRATIQITITE